MAFSGSTSFQPGAGAAWRTTLRDLSANGDDVHGDNPSRELLGYNVVIEDPLRRMATSPARPFPLITAVARFVWTMAGNERLADIAFYEPMVTRYTDDHLTVPGSNYGTRLRRPSPGFDQVRGAIDRLRGGDEAIAGSDGGLRRAANVIWKPEDAVRASLDIPCAFGLFYFPRHGKLTTQLVMRSNNAVALLPFNLFEFTLLAETVAVEAELGVGPFRLDAMSMHLYPERDQERVQAILDRPGTDEVEMPPMELGSNPLGQIDLLARLEASLRHEQGSLSSEPLSKALARGDELDSYWRPFFNVLLAYALAKAGRREEASGVANDLPDYFLGAAQADLQKRFPTEDTTSDLRLFTTPTPGAAVAQALRGESVDARHLHELLDEIERSEKIRISHDEATEVRRILEEQRVEVAARSNSDGAPEDFKALDRDEVLSVIRRLGLDR